MIRWKYLALVVLAALLLGACSGTAEPTATDTPLQEPATATSRPVASAPTTEPTLAPPTETQTAQSPQEATALPAPTPDTSFLNVRPGEWVRGPDDATVTIIEYSDFQ
jgi:PBP1b-binding outer membrane lipoprotein LpoB